MIIFKQIHLNHRDISFPIRPLIYIVAWGKNPSKSNLITIDRKILAFNMINDSTFILCVCFCSCLLIVCMFFFYFFVFVLVQWHIITMTSWSSISWCILLYAIIKQVAQTYGFSVRSTTSSIHPFIPTHCHFESLPGSFIHTYPLEGASSLTKIILSLRASWCVHFLSNILWKIVTPPKSQHSFKEGKNVHT